jgi:membrane fusion protein (multidrug efflux system)
MESDSHDVRALRSDSPAPGGQPTETQDPEAGAGAVTGNPRSTAKQRPRGRLALIALAIVVLLVIGGAYAWWYESHFVTTDDAFIDTRIAAVSPRVPGRVIAVPVVDNEKVAAGEVLVRIDPATYQVALQQALAAEQLAKTGLGEARANVAVAGAALEQARASLISTQAQTANALANLHRYLFLRHRNIRALARTQLDQVEAAARSARAELRAARQRVVGAQAQLGASRAAVAGASARVASARAQVAAARLDLNYTTVRAAQAGHIAQKSVALGNYVSPGQELMALVPLKVWVTANFKETDLYLIHPGQRVSIHIDACPRADAHGHVQSIQRGSGEAFDLLPPQNATGNYIKIVQRVPVRIAFDSIPKGCVLGPGMSVEPDVRIN